MNTRSVALCEDVLIDGTWRTAEGEIYSTNSPITGEPTGGYRRSSWAEIDTALTAGARATELLETVEATRIAGFLNSLADAILASAVQLAETAAAETGLPLHPRLADLELPAMADQLRQAATATLTDSWRQPTLSTTARIASQLGPIPGVVVVIGPNNFPFRFNAMGGGDFAAAIATGHAVLGKAHPLHPRTTNLLARLIQQALGENNLPPATVQFVFDMDPQDGLRMVADERVAATAFTGSRDAGLALKSAADAAGKPIYLELASLNPVVVLPGAAAQSGAEIGRELAASVTNGMGQFCTCPSLIFTIGQDFQAVASGLAAGMSAAVTHSMLAEQVARNAESAVGALTKAGASVVGQGTVPNGAGCAPRALSVSGSEFLADPQALQIEAFGPVTLVVATADIDELTRCLLSLSGNLAGVIYAADGDIDTPTYRIVEPLLRRRVGRLLNNKVPTGVAVAAAMNHGGPYPSTGHPGFTAVGIPASLVRFGMLQSYDNVRDEFLPAQLQAANPLGIQRFVNGTWTADEIEWGT